MADSSFKSLEKKVILVTGGAQGIGAAIVRSFIKNKSKVYFTYRHSKAEASALIESLPRDAEVHALLSDASSRPDAEKCIDHILEKEQSLDVLVNNAGIIRDGLFLTMSDEDWDEVIATNLGSVYNYTKAVLRPMIMQGGGRIINVSSIVGELGGFGQANYSASKGAINSLTKSLAAEYASKNVTVNAVAPGMISTRMSEAVRSNFGDKILEKIPLGSFGEPKDIAAVVTFLASDEARYITGQILAVDGGLSLLNRR